MNESNFLPLIEIDKKDLPSRGLAYPKDAKISYRTYMHGEVRQASTSTVGIENSLKMAMDGINVSFGVRNLTLQDGIYLAVLRKISTMGGMRFGIPFVCSRCETVGEGSFKHSDIEFNDVSDEIESFPLYVDIKNKEVEISPMTVGEFLDLKNGKYSDTIKGSEVDRTATQAITIKNMSFSESYDFIYTITKEEDRETITHVDKSIYHDIKELEAECKGAIDGKACGHINSIKLGGREALIRPFRKYEGVGGARIRFKPTPKSECVSA